MEEKLGLLTELIKLAKSDKEVREQEYMFILSIGQMLGITEQQISGLFNDYIEMPPPAEENQRIMQFYRMILLMNVDQEVTPEELDKVRSAGLRFGLRPQAIEEVLQEMKKDERGIIPENILIDIFRKHRN